MSLFEKGKGKRKAQWSIEQFGRILRTHELGPDAMLPGYCTFPSDSAARDAAVALVAERVKKGFAPAEGQDGEFITSESQSTPTPSCRLPFRHDIFVDNEANGFMVTSMSMAGVRLDEGSKKWDKAVADGKIFPVTLTQDDGLIVRVVAGEPLTTQETEEWVARAEWFLHVPDGKLAITGGAVLVNEEYDEDDTYHETYLREVPIPPGTYRIAVLAYVPGINGKAALDHLAGGYDKSEPLGQWFRRSYPGEAFPEWLRDWCTGDPRTDPGHEKEWKSAVRTELSAETVDFIIHLEPLEGAPPAGKPVLEDGWFPVTEGARLPKECPRGLTASNVTGHDAEGKAGEWIYVYDAYDVAKSFALTPITGGPVELSPAEILELVRIAEFTNGMGVPEMRVRFPDGFRYSLPARWPGNVLGFITGQEMRVAFSNGSGPGAIHEAITALHPLVAAFPDGTEVELVFAPQSEAIGDRPYSLHRYRGRIAKGKWSVAEAFPQITAEALRGAMALAREVAGGDGIVVADDREVEATREWVLKTYGDWLEDYPVEFKEGRLVMKEREPQVLVLFGAGIFARRYGSLWPVNPEPM